MPIYTVSTNRIVNGSVVRHGALPCWKHTDCNQNEEMARACGEEARKVEESDPIWTARYTYTDRRWDYSVSPSVEKEEVVQCEAICYRHHVGRVVAKGVDYNKQVMSDVWDNVPYVIILNDSGHYQKIETYGGPGYDAQSHLKPYAPSPEVDASPEMIAAYMAHIAAEQAAAEKARRESEARRAAQRAEEERKAPRKGRTLRVVKGRKVPKGTEGVCFWVGESQWGKRVGMKVAGETVWVDAKNVEAV